MFSKSDSVTDGLPDTATLLKQRERRRLIGSGARRRRKQRSDSASPYRSSSARRSARLSSPNARACSLSPSSRDDQLASARPCATPQPWALLALATVFVATALAVIACGTGWYFWSTLAAV